MWGVERRVPEKFILGIWRLLSSFPGLQLFLVRLFGASFPTGVAAVIEDESGRVILFRHTYRGKHPWGLPGGWLKKRESPDRCLIREVEEESGLAIEPVAPLLALAGSKRARVEIIYWARAVGGSFRPSIEVDAAQSFGPDDLPIGLMKYQADVIKLFFKAKTGGTLPCGLAERIDLLDT